MKTIIWKELREQSMWAMLLFAGMSVALSFSLYDQAVWHLGREPATIISVRCQIVIAFGAPIAALLLGFLQIVPELLRDQWSFLIHRPATRAQLFAGKMSAGIILYLFAVLLPILGAILWTAMPGHVAAPFRWRMVGIPLIDVLVGFAYYFAAQLIALRHARWYATRILPIATAILASIGVVGAPAFIHALLVVLLAWAVLGSAAWGEFAASGDYPAQSRAARFSLGLILAIGIFTVTALAAGLIESAKPSPDYSWSQYFVNHDGRVLIAHYDSRSRQTTITDRQGHPVPEYADPERASQYYNHNLPLCQVLPGWQYKPSYRHTSWAYQQIRDEPRETWYFVPDLELIEGFDVITRQRIGWIGANGFSLEASNALSFPRPNDFWAGGDLITCAEKVYRVSWSDRKVETVFTAPAGETIRGACELPAPSPDSRSNRQSSARMGTAIALNSRIVVLDLSNKPLFVTPYQVDAKSYGFLQIGPLPQNRFMLWYARLISWPMKESIIVELSSTGEELSREALPDLPAVVTQHIARDEAALMGGIPLSGYAIVFLVGDLLDPFDRDESWSQRFEKVWTGFKEGWEQQHAALVISLVTFALCMLVSLILCEWIARRYAFSSSERWTWRVLPVLLGIFAVQTLLSLRDWPSRVRCVSCSRPRRVDRELCEHCGRPVPPSEIHRGDLFDAESPQGSNLPTPVADLTKAVIH